jgi:hypothetical protein
MLYLVRRLAPTQPTAPLPRQRWGRRDVTGECCCIGTDERSDGKVNDVQASSPVLTQLKSNAFPY